MAADPQAAGAEETLDEDLVSRVLAGERGAFGELYRRHGPRVARFVRFRVSDAAAAEDLTQDVFVRALRGLPRLKERRRVGAWLMRIAHNRVCNYYRATSNAPSQVPLDPRPGDDDEAPRLPEPHADPTPDIERRIAAEALLRRATGLTDLQRQVLSLRFIAGLSLAETASLVGRNANAVKQIQYRALAELRRRVPPEDVA